MRNNEQAHLYLYLYMHLSVISRKISRVRGHELF